jgi:hypothetical protein
VLQVCIVNTNLLYPLFLLMKYTLTCALEKKIYFLLDLVVNLCHRLCLMLEHPVVPLLPHLPPCPDMPAIPPLQRGMKRGYDQSFPDLSFYLWGAVTLLLCCCSAGERGSAPAGHPPELAIDHTEEEGTVLL